jgi:hypothetical protein
MKNRKAQVTLFIILSLIILISVLILLTVKQQKPSTSYNEENPQQTIESCTTEALEEAIDILSNQGGDINPSGFTTFRDEKLVYLCYNQNFYLPCINQRPELVSHIETEITDYIRPIVNKCFNQLKSNLEKKYSVELEGMNLKTDLKKDSIKVEIERKLTFSREGETKTFQDYVIEINSPLYEMAKTAMEVANQEANYCNFDILSYMVFYPDQKLEKFRPGDQDVIYYITDIKSKKMFKFAIKSCALPPGF